MIQNWKREWQNACRYFATTSLCFCIATNIALAQRESKTINDSWRFQIGESVAAADSAFNDNTWEVVNLPHTWNTDAYVVRDYYKGTGWYRKSFTLPQQWVHKHIFLKLEGASKDATIYINGNKVGEHAGGYTACTFDVTPFLHTDANNVIAVKVDNARQDIAPTSADFTFFGGIYRDVWLTAVPNQHFRTDNMASDGIFISTPQVSSEAATIAVRGEVVNKGAEKSSLEVVCTIYNPDGNICQTAKQRLKLTPGETVAFNTTSEPINSPLLWTPETPHLYTVETCLIDPKSNTIIDRIVQHTAFRWYSFDGDNGFFLNGEPYKLRGICRHQDQKPFGPALSDEMHRRDIVLAKEMGANFIRISHYPQDNAVLEMCDKLGILVWEEIPIINLVPDTPGFAENCERNLREMIRQHYNHPSVILWGYMNEILLQVNFSDTVSVNRALSLARHLEQVLKEEDNTRLSTMAMAGSDFYNTCGLSQIPDVIGWNLYQGWYYSTLDGFEEYLADQHKNYPTHPIIVSEYGAGSDKRLHSLAPKAFDFSSEYQQIYLEHYLPVLENTPYLCGGSHWNFIDFGSAERDESMPRINNKGLVRADRSPKDVYYYYQACWRSDIPVLHIASRDWQRRAGVSCDGMPVTMPVKIYSNLDNVELFIDGKQVAKQSIANYNTVFQVPFTHGSHLIMAQGVYNGELVQDAITIDFTTIPDQLTADNLQGLELAINVGSNCSFTSDASNLIWLPDRPYSPGGWGYIGGKAASTNTEIHGTPDNPLYQTLRTDIEGYRFDLPQGDYEVELLFADIYRPAQSSAYLLGSDKSEESRSCRFSIIANGTLLDENFAPGDENGYFQAIRRKYIVRNDADCLELRFKTLNGKSFLNGIKLRRL